jgi:hypothetical protein
MHLNKAYYTFKLLVPRPLQIRLRALDVPYITPAVCIVLLLKQGEITLPDALEKLELLSPLISSDEYNTVKWALDTWRLP